MASVGTGSGPRWRWGPTPLTLASLRQPELPILGSFPEREPLLPVSIHHYPDAEVSGGILAELWLERRPAVRS